MRPRERPKPYAPEGEAQKILPPEKWTPGIKKVVAYAEYVSQKLINTYIRTKIVTDIGWPFEATFGPSGDLTMNLGRLGHAWFDGGDWGKVDELLIHEFSHYRVLDHLSSAFHDECCRLGALLVKVTLEDPTKMKLLRS